MIAVQTTHDIEKHGFSIKETHDEATVYSKQAGDFEVAVWAFGNSISIDLSNNKKNAYCCALLSQHTVRTRLFINSIFPPSILTQLSHYSHQ